VKTARDAFAPTPEEEALIAFWKEEQPKAAALYQSELARNLQQSARNEALSSKEAKRADAIGWTRAYLRYQVLTTLAKQAGSKQSPPSKLGQELEAVRGFQTPALYWKDQRKLLEMREHALVRSLSESKREIGSRRMQQLLDAEKGGPLVQSLRQVQAELQQTREWLQAAEAPPRIVSFLRHMMGKDLEKFIGKKTLKQKTDTPKPDMMGPF
jgi:hypothetical protein